MTMPSDVYQVGGERQCITIWGDHRCERVNGHPGDHICECEAAISPDHPWADETGSGA